MLNLLNCIVFVIRGSLAQNLKGQVVGDRVLLRFPALEPFSALDTLAAAHV